ncbi:MAG: cryptochrome/photolyase family protein, partial [Acidimicrobiia bacterium]
MAEPGGASPTRSTSKTTVWVLGDQLDPRMGALAEADPDTHRVLIVEAADLLGKRRWHRQRAHLVVASMHRFAGALTNAGFDVDHRVAPTMVEGVRAHLAEFVPPELLVTEPNSRTGRRVASALGATQVRSDQFLCHHDEFASWANGRRTLRMEDFYRWNRSRLGYLMDGNQPAGGRWNFDADNREPPPGDGRSWPEPVRVPLDDVDRRVLAALPSTCWGGDPDGTWATNREHALRQLRHAIDVVLPVFGPHEDAMLSSSWHLAHSLLSPALNIGLLHPREVCDEIEIAYRSGLVPIASAEGLLRQILGWREYVWGVYWLWGEQYAALNALDAIRPLPPLYTGAATDMQCLRHALGAVHDHGWTHHIQRLMILGNLALLSGVRPLDLVEWMTASFVDSAEWVMLPNVIGMALHADGGMMATKPYAAGGAYIDKMSDYCRTCSYDRKQRAGPDACPYTTLYWNFSATHAERFDRNPR